MRIVLSTEIERPVARPVVLAAGFFDGVHLGHGKVIDGAVREAHGIGAEAWVLTFDRHPRKVLFPEGAPKLISTDEVRLELIAERGVDGIYLIHFDKEVASEKPEVFASRLTKTFPNLKSVHCGSNWRFGSGAAGEPCLLAEVGLHSGFAVEVEREVLYQGSPVSSTRVRELVATGDLASAAAMLGRRFSIRGKVEHGRRVGSANGVATANFMPDCSMLLPPNGVYAVTSIIDGRQVLGVADLGFRPTFADAMPSTPVLETHYLDFDGDLYGRTLDVDFIGKIRDEKRFQSPDALFKQIAKDIEAARNMLE